MCQAIATDRLQLSPVSQVEAGELHQLWMQPAVRKYLWDDRVIPLSDTERIVDQSIALFEQNRYGIWLARLLGEEVAIGFCGYWSFFDPPQVQLIYGLDCKYWGKGLATEMGRAMLEYGFQQLGFATICASTDLPNRASIAVLERLGMRFEQQVTIDNRDTIFYRIEREQFS